MLEEALRRWAGKWYALRLQQLREQGWSDEELRDATLVILSTVLDDKLAEVKKLQGLLTEIAKWQ